MDSRAQGKSAKRRAARATAAESDALDPVIRTVRSWEELAQLIDACTGDSWIFRGVTNVSHELMPTIGRPESRINPFTGQPKPFSATEERRMVDEFRRIARPHLASGEINDLELLAIAQHHGMPTRLLDWTESPLVAAYFAAEVAGAIDKPPGIYAVKGLSAMTEDEDPFNLKAVAIYRPPHINPRIPAQSAVFTVHPEPDKNEMQNLQLELWQFRTEDNNVLWLRRVLDRCGINRASLFPDLDGLAQHLGWRYKWGVY